MADSMIQNLLKTPRQIREEQLQKMRNEAAGRAQLGGPIRGASSALPGIFSSVLQQQRPALATDIAQTARGLTQGLGGMLGAAGYQQAGQALAQATVTPEERQAAQTQSVLSSANMGNAASLKSAAQKLRQVGNVQAALALEQRASDLLSAEAELNQKQQEIDIKKRKNAIESLKSYAAMTLKVGDDVIDNSDPASVVEALNLIDADPKKLNEARLLLKAKPVAKTEITIDQKGESEFVKALGKEQAKQYTTSVDNIQANTASVRTLNEMETQLNSGEIFTGAGANILLQTSKVLNLGGLGDEEKVARTETFMKTAAQEVLNIMGSGKLGAGTGLSDGDRDFAKQVVAGDITLSEKAIRDLIDVNRRANVYAIKKHNQRVDQYNARYKNANLPREFYIGQEAVVDDVTYTYDGEGWVAK